MVDFVAKLSTNGVLGASLTSGGNSGPVVGSNNYEDLINLPKINSVTLVGNKTLEDLGYQAPESLTNAEIEQLINSIML